MQIDQSPRVCTRNWDVPRRWLLKVLSLNASRIVAQMLDPFKVTWVKTALSYGAGAHSLVGLQNIPMNGDKTPRRQRLSAPWWESFDSHDACETFQIHLQSSETLSCLKGQRPIQCCWRASGQVGDQITGPYPLIPGPGSEKAWFIFTWHLC